MADVITPDYSRYLALVKTAFEWATGDPLAGQAMAEEGLAAGLKANWPAADFADYVIIEAAKEMRAAGHRADYPRSKDYPAGFDPIFSSGEKKKEAPRWRRH